MAEQIIFSDYQAEVFNEAENLLRTQGYLGEQLFEDTYVLQKRVAEWVISNVPIRGSGGSLMSEATNTYNGVLGIATDESPAPVIIKPTLSEPVQPTPPRSIREFPSFGITGRPPMKPMPMKPAIATQVASTPSKPVVRPIPTSITRPQGGGRTNPINTFFAAARGLGNGRGGNGFGS